MRKTRAIISSFHKYQPYGGEFYQPIFDFFIHNLTKFKDEYDKLYILDSGWHFSDADKAKIAEAKGVVIESNQHLRYYDAYKEFLPNVTEEEVLFIDNDMVIYRAGVIDETFKLLESKYDVVSIYDTIGEKTFKELHGKSKFCPYWFATRTQYLMQYRDCEWGPVPWGETLSELTLRMLDDKVKCYEWPEDKSSVLFDGSIQYAEHHKPTGVGYYHIRAGTVPSLLLAYKENDKEKYDDYLKNQPKTEYLRQMAWFNIMTAMPRNDGVMYSFTGMLADINMGAKDWMEYLFKFMEFHGLTTLE
jgi:hypothetical protein